MENNDTNTDSHEFVRLGDQKWEIVEITMGIIFFNFCLRYVFTIFYTGRFQVPPKKYHPHLKGQFPPEILIWPKSLLYEHSEKWLSPLLAPHHPGGEGACRLWRFIYIWLIPKFSICKCFCNCRNHHFRLLLDGFLALPNSPNCSI